MTLSLFLLGPPRVEINGEAINFPRQKSLALLVYLAVTGEQQRRDTLAALLWPESADARGSLRRELSSLKSTLSDGEWLDADRESIALSGNVWLDIDDFLRAAQNDDPASLAQAADLYRGDFLSGFSLADAPDYDDWRFFQAEEYRRLLAGALEHLIAHHQNAGDPTAAILYARRHLALDNLHEPAHRTLMRLYALAGQQAAALRQYDECVRLLDEELGVLPEEETSALHEAIRTRRFAADDRVTGRQGDTMTSSHHPFIPSSLHLPTLTTSFIGREMELSELIALLARPDVRLATVVAPGGMGKSRLAIEAARRLSGEYPDGVWFLSLVGVNEASQMLSALVQLLDAPMGQGDALAAILRFLAPRRLLLVLDNFEQLAAHATILVEIAQGVPGVKLLVTSRVRLNLREEWAFLLEGLGTESVGALLAAPGEATRLFVERAQQVHPDFAPAVEATSIVAICRAVEGMPLGIELAASWLRAMTCGEIAAEIGRDVDFLSTPLRNVPEQHRSMRAVFERSWALLTPEEQRGLARLSVFQGSFTRQAAAAVANARLPLLSALVDHSLLRHSVSGRYDIHEFLRQFAAEKLAASDEAESIHDKHAAHFLSLLADRTDDLQWRRPEGTVKELLPDRENLFAGWRWAVKQQHLFELIRGAASGFLVFCNHSNAQESALSSYQAALVQVESATELTQDSRSDLLGRLIWRLDVLDNVHRSTEVHMAELMKAKGHLLESRTDNREEVALVNVYLAMALATQGRNTEAVQCLEQAISTFSELSNLVRLGWVYNMYCFLEIGRGRPTFARHWHENAVAAWQDGGIARSPLLSDMMLCSMEGDYERMRASGEKALSGTPDPFRFENGSGRGRGFILQTLGEWAILSGEFGRAEEYFQQANSILLEEGQPWQLAMSFQLSLGTLYRLQHKWESARTHIQSLLETIRSIGYRQRIATRLHELARLEHDLGNYGEAEAALAEALAIAHSIDFLFFEARILCQIGHTAAAQSKPEAAAYYRRALEIASEQGMNPIVLDVLQGAAGLAAQAGAVAQAVEWLALAASHPNGEWETKQRAGKALAELEGQPSADEFSAAQKRGQKAELVTVIPVVLAWLA
ncbi:MAG: tetratricopeptide repeat protein [Chloroflexi bacterium]|nr:tetratricopeptide repeat protein [Chloroflexota bacterium]